MLLAEARGFASSALFPRSLLNLSLSLSIVFLGKYELCELRLLTSASRFHTFSCFLRVVTVWNSQLQTLFLYRWILVTSVKDLDCY